MFDETAAEASGWVYDLNSKVKQTQRLLRRSRGSTSVKESVQSLSVACNDANAVFARLSAFEKHQITNTQKQTQATLEHEFSELLKQVHGLQNVLTLHAKNAIQQEEPQPTESTPLIQIIDQVDQAQLDIHSSLVEEREHEINEIQRGMREINAIFNDLGVLIGEQGHHIDTFEENIGTLAQTTQNASQQLTRASNYQRSRGKWSCIALLVLLVICILVGLSIFSRAGGSRR